VIIKKITYDEILPIWKNYLWKGRISTIKPTSGLKLNEGYDKQIEEYTPTFFGAFIGDECIGVNSGHATSESDYRSRGIYVFPKHRRKGIAQQLFKAVENQCRLENIYILWSMPRESALLAYKKYGFIVISEMFNDMEFGPNCFVMKLLES